MKSLADMTPEERLEEFARTEWTLVTVQGFKLGSNEPLEEHIKMSGDIEWVVEYWFERHGWDPARSHIVHKEFMGVLQ